MVWIWLSGVIATLAAAIFVLVEGEGLLACLGATGFVIALVLFWVIWGTVFVLRAIWSTWRKD
jgi:hypothetical protein